MIWRSRNLLAGLLNSKKISHNFRKLGNKFKNIMENRLKMMDNKKKEHCIEYRDPTRNTPTNLVHWSIRPHKPPQRYTPSNYIYILLNGEGEQHCF